MCRNSRLQLLGTWLCRTQASKKVVQPPSLHNHPDGFRASVCELSFSLSSNLPSYPLSSGCNCWEGGFLIAYLGWHSCSSSHHLPSRKLVFVIKHIIPLNGVWGLGFGVWGLGFG